MTQRAAAWAAWCICLLSLTLALAGLVLVWLYFGTLSGWLSTQATGNGLMAITFSAAGVAIVVHRPRNLVGWLFCALGPLNGIAAFTGGYGRFASTLAGEALPAGLWAAWLTGWVWAPAFGLGFVFVPLLFPDGRLPSPRWRPVAWLGSAGIVTIMVAVALKPGRIGATSVGGLPAVDNPVGLEAGAAVLAAMVPLALLVLVVASVAAFSSLVNRFRRARGAVRQQIKWFAYATAVSVFVYLGAALLPQFIPDMPDEPRPLLLALAYLSTAATPLAIGVAIVRYRLYDIDRLVNRTVVYAAVTAALAFTYWLSVVVLQRLLQPMTQGSDLAIVASTLAVAALFQPARRRVQETVDRRFYRRRYDAERTLQTFSASLRQDVNLDALSTELLDVVSRTMQPSHLSLWLRDRAP